MVPEKFSRNLGHVIRTKKFIFFLSLNKDTFKTKQFLIKNIGTYQSILDQPLQALKEFYHQRAA